MMRKAIVAALLLMAGCQDTSAPDRSGADVFAFSAQLEPQGAATVQRIDLPAAALVAIARDDLGDVRLLDARGKPLPLARLDAVGRDAVTANQVPFYPVANGAGSAQSNAVSVEIAQPGQTVSIATAGTLAKPNTAAALLDTRKLVQPAAAVQLDADLPAQTPVSFTIEAGSDLKNWDVLADKVLFSPAAGEPPLGGARITLPGSRLEGRYLRLSWPADAGVTLRGGTVETARSTPDAPVLIATRGGKLDDAHNLRLDVPAAAPLAGLQFVVAKSDGLLPMRLYGREANELPWQALGAAVARGPAEPARFDLPGVRFAQYRIEADSRSAGFAAAPEVIVHLQPISLIAALNGEAPYRLMVGKIDAEPRYFSPGDLADAKALEADLPRAVIKAGPPPIVNLDPGTGDSPFSPRKLALWGALLLGTAVLAWGAIRMLRANAGAQSAS